MNKLPDLPGEYILEPPAPNLALFTVELETST
jgi:hypothetical protein